jgi:hypothetical protein
MSETQTPERLTAQDVLTKVGYDGFVRSLFNRSGDPAKDFAHAVLGIVTEVYEMRAALEPVNQLEEAGDLTFYGYALKQVVGDWLKHDDSTQDYGFDLHALAAAEVHISAAQVGTAQQYIDSLINEMLDTAKRWVGYGKPPADIVHTLAQGCYVALGTVEDCGMALDTGLMELANVKKLLERYNGMTFNAERAVNRDLAAERSVLEHAAAA